ncbi:MAG: tRNA lysidine(34) synthetase TilS [Zoogloeaceae bacterium]|nr:tRNA lysidine(34) synthetase TilS [Zoogloeaceae bacterium]
MGLSGGRDSVVLLHICKTLLPGRLAALHVHHGLSPNADAWADFCVTLCRDWQIPLTITRVTVARKSREGMEAAARAARHAAFHASGARYLALAHHRHDQAETLLFNLCRGAGIKGAAAMTAQREMAGVTLLRPLLTVSAAAIALYAETEKLVWVEDESNADEDFRRNFLRHRILPELARHFPAVETTLARAAGHFAEADALLAEYAAEDDRRVQDCLAPFLALSPSRQANWLRYRLVRQRWRMPETAALAEALRQLAATRNLAGTRFELRLPEGSVRVWQGRFHFVPHLAETPQARDWDGATPCAWAGGCLRLQPAFGKGLSAARLAGKRLEIRLRQGGEHLALTPRRPRRPLKKLLQETGIPPWQRARQPLLYCENELIACPGIGVAATWQCPPDAPGWWPVWEQELPLNRFLDSWFLSGASVCV